MRDRIALAGVSLLLSAGMLACSGASSPGGTGAGGDGGLRDGAVGGYGAGKDASGLDAADAGAADVGVVEGGATGEGGSGVHNPSCCVRSASYDAMCTSMGEPPVAYVCFCPDGGIDPSCTINMGAELVCCP